MVYDNNNIFAKIIRGETGDRDRIVYEDEYMMSFKDKDPLGEVHLLVIPKGQYLDYADFITRATGEEKQHFFDTIPLIAKNAGLTDYRLLTHKGKKGGQTVFHFHVHIIYDSKYSLR